MKKVLPVLLILLVLGGTIAVQPVHASIKIEIQQHFAEEHKHASKTSYYDHRTAKITVARDQAGIKEITITWKQRADKKYWVHAIRQFKPTKSSWIHPYQTLTGKKYTYKFKTVNNVREAWIEILFELPDAFPRGFNVIAENKAGSKKHTIGKGVFKGFL